MSSVSASGLTRLQLHFGPVSAQITSDTPAFTALLRAIWGRCLSDDETGSPDLARTGLAARVERRDDRLVVYVNGRRIGRAATPGNAYFALEEALILPLLAQLKQRESLLHAALFAIGGRAVLILGQSGSGKSTLALAALQAGHDVRADEWVMVRDEGLVGIPRALMFDGVWLDSTLPHHLTAADDSPYVMQTSDGRWHQKPLVALPAPTPTALDPTDCLVVFAQRGTRDLLEAGTPLQGLAWLQSASFGRARDLGHIGSEAVRLVWNEPSAGLRLIEGTQP